jgi:phenylalanyl-tRNA synthetase beta chain
MQFSESWLRQWVNPAIDTDALAQLLTMAGLEVEEIAPAAPAFSGVVAARIIEIALHPDANKLRICQVDDGSGALLQIVCGASNAAVGLTVPLARVGAELPGGIKIGMAKMRGVESKGMLCSGSELGLAQAYDGLMVLTENATLGMSIRELLDLDDTLFTVKLTPNRADCLSVLGMAREVAALTGAPLTVPDVTPVAVTLNDRVAVTIDAPDLCGRFTGRVIRGVNARAQTPQWMQTHLERAGQRSVSALVDISNYVMLAMGRPSHVFDLDHIQGDLTVRWAQAGESLRLLNSQTITLTPDVGVVAASKQVESLAGIMGGEATAVTLDTTNIYIEAAFWWPQAIAGRARRYKFSSEASHRFERGVDFADMNEHLEYISHLILEICGGQAGPIDDQTMAVPERKPVTMRAARCCKVLGIEVSDAEISQIFTRLGFAFKRQDDAYVVQPPSFRFDLQIEEDLIEEVARVYGFERIPDVPPLARAKMYAQPEGKRSLHAVRRLVATQDYQEVVNFSFVEIDWERELAGNADPIALQNPIASYLAVMRSSLIGGLLANIRFNANRKQSRVRVFELGRVFKRDASVVEGPLTVQGIAQPLMLACAAWGAAAQEQWGQLTRAVDFFDVKADVQALFGARADALRFVAGVHPALHPGRNAQVLLGERAIGWLGELHPRWVQQAELGLAPVVFELDAETVAQARLPQVQEITRQPVVQRDLALWVDSAVPVQAMLDTIAQTSAQASPASVVREVRLFDVWREPQATERSQQKSLAFRFWLQDADKTLDDARVDACMAALRDALIARHGARLRA